jgi:hypothetical protein
MKTPTKRQKVINVFDEELWEMNGRVCAEIVQDNMEIVNRILEEENKKGK